MYDPEFAADRDNIWPAFKFMKGQLHGDPTAGWTEQDLDLINEVSAYLAECTLVNRDQPLQEISVLPNLARFDPAGNVNEQQAEIDEDGDHPEDVGAMEHIMAACNVVDVGYFSDQEEEDSDMDNLGDA